MPANEPLKLKVVTVNLAHLEREIRYHSHPLGWLSLKKNKIKMKKKRESNMCWPGCGVIGTLVHYQWERKMV